MDCENCRTIRLYWICMANIIMWRVAKGVYFYDVIENSAGRGTPKEWQLILQKMTSFMYEIEWNYIGEKSLYLIQKVKTKEETPALTKIFLSSSTIRSGYISKINYFGDREKCIGRVNLKLTCFYFWLQYNI